VDTINLSLNEPGVWDVALSDLALSSQFLTNFWLALQPFISFPVGIGCDAFNPKNNGVTLFAPRREYLRRAGEPDRLELRIVRG
jgi:hypothetical protein